MELRVDGLRQLARDLRQMATESSAVTIKLALRGASGDADEIATLLQSSLTHPATQPKNP